MEKKNSIIDENTVYNILLVEDNLLNQILAKKVLTDRGWNVEVAENGLSAIEKLEKNNFDIILMDIQMPEMDGYETTCHIRKKLIFPKCDTPIIAITAHAILGVEEKCISMGMNDYVAKPFDEKILYSKILSVLNKKNFSENKFNDSIDNKTETNTKHMIDLTYLKNISRGSNEFMLKMTLLLLEQIPEAVNNLEKHLINKGWKALRAVAHKLKPSFSFIGVKELENSIKSVEEHAENETNLDLLPEIISSIKNISGRAIIELESEKKLFM